MYFEELYSTALTKDIKKQTDLAAQRMNPESAYLKKWCENNDHIVRTTEVALGQGQEAGHFIYKDNFYNRAFVCFPKFRYTPDTFCMIRGNYIRGLN